MEDILISSDESSDEKNLQRESEEDWSININDEKIFWRNIMIPNLLYPPNICPYCYKNGFRKNEKQNIYIINPFYLLCHNKK